MLIIFGFLSIKNLIDTETRILLPSKILTFKSLIILKTLMIIFITGLLLILILDILNLIYIYSEIIIIALSILYT